MFTGAFLVAKVKIVESTLAAPPMSARILSMLEDGLREIPPVSKVIPFPTNTTGFVPGALL